MRSREVLRKAGGAWWCASRCASWVIDSSRECSRMSSSQPVAQSASERRAAEAALRALVGKFAPEGLRLVAAVRRSLRKRLPAAHEVVYEYRDCVVISFSPRGHGYEGVIAIRARAEGVKLYFHQGKSLPDPEKLLRGSAQTRWILLEAASTLTRPGVASLLEEAIAHNRVPFAETGRGSVVIRVTTAAKRAPSRPAARKAQSKRRSG